MSQSREGGEIVSAALQSLDGSEKDAEMTQPMCLSPCFPTPVVLDRPGHDGVSACECVIAQERRNNDATDA